MNKPLKFFNNLTAEQVLSSMQTLDEQGIEQMEFFDQKQDPKYSQKQIYQFINHKLFAPYNLSYKTGQGLPSTLPNQQKCKATRSKQKNPLNRKHLKALGYNWDRNEFEFQPESIFGLLIGSLQKNDKNELEYQELSQVLYKYYRQEQDVFQQVKNYMINTLFLLGRKGLHQMQGVPPCIAELRNCEEEIKKLIGSIYDITNGLIVKDEPQQIQKEQADSKPKQAQPKQLSEQDRQERSRSRDNRKKKKKYRSKSQDSYHRKHSEKKKRKRRHKHQRSQQKQPKRQQYEPQDQKSSHKHNQKRIERDRNSADNSSQPVRRGRGRPRGSLNKRKNTNDRMDVEQPIPQRTIVLKKSQFANKDLKKSIQTKKQDRVGQREGEDNSGQSKGSQKKTGRPRKSLYINSPLERNFSVQFE